MMVGSRKKAVLTIIVLVVCLAIVTLFTLSSHRNSQASTAKLNDALYASLFSDNDVIIQNGGAHIENAKYFDKNTWVVATVIPEETITDPATIVAKKEKDGFHIILGPGTLFAINSMRGIPDDVSNYLNDRGLVTTSDEN